MVVEAGKGREKANCRDKVIEREKGEYADVNRSSHDNNCSSGIVTLTFFVEKKNCVYLVQENV